MQLKKPRSNNIKSIFFLICIDLEISSISIINCDLFSQNVYCNSKNVWSENCLERLEATLRSITLQRTQVRETGKFAGFVLSHLEHWGDICFFPGVRKPSFIKQSDRSAAWQTLILYEASAGLWV